MSKVPKNPVHLMGKIYGKIFPKVHQELGYWKKKAESIPNEELRKQALASIESKTFHCEGGSVYALLAGDRWPEAVKFIVAYQTISDYLDNLCDRSTSLDPDDFRLLHDSMLDALSPENKPINYYRLREEQNDGGYLNELVITCQEMLRLIPEYTLLQDNVLELSSLYGDLQVHKHVKVEERIPRLENWFKEHQEKYADLRWYEFSACSGSTLGIFCMVSYALGDNVSSALSGKIFQSYFPYMQGLHILLDYYIDQNEDKLEGDLNFCNYYESESEMEERFLYFIEETIKHVEDLPNPKFHRMVQKGLVGMYLADQKVKSLKGAGKMIKSLLNASGLKAKFFYLNTKVYHKLRPGLS